MRKRHCTNQQKTSFGIPSGSVRDSLDHRSDIVRSSFDLRYTFARTSLEHRSDIVRTSFAKPEVTKEEAWWFGWQPSSERRQRKPASNPNPTCCLPMISPNAPLPKESCRIYSQFCNTVWLCPRKVEPVLYPWASPQWHYSNLRHQES